MIIFRIPYTLNIKMFIALKFGNYILHVVGLFTVGYVCLEIINIKYFVTYSVILKHF